MGVINCNCNEGPLGVFNREAFQYYSIPLELYTARFHYSNAKRSFISKLEMPRLEVLKLQLDCFHIACT